MSYRCQQCDAVVASGTPMLRRVLKRQNGQIAREVPVCASCLKNNGVKMLLKAVARHQGKAICVEPLPPD